MSRDLFSIRMHATLAGRHLSGAEQLAFPDDLPTLSRQMVARALEHERGRADVVRVSIEPVEAAALVQGKLPDLRSLHAASVAAARDAAGALLRTAGVSAVAVGRAMRSLADGPAPDGGAMRGAMLLDAVSGARLEADPARGIRATRFGLAPDCTAAFRAALAVQGLDNLHVREALVLAAKVLAAPGMVAELCWSDDPSYVTGYVSAPDLGYVRLSPLKETGVPRGGRAFFVHPGADLDALHRFLERTPFLVTALGRVAGTEEVT